MTDPVFGKLTSTESGWQVDSADECIVRLRSRASVFEKAIVSIECLAGDAPTDSQRTAFRSLCEDVEISTKILAAALTVVQRACDCNQSSYIENQRLRPPSVTVLQKMITSCKVHVQPEAKGVARVDIAFDYYSRIPGTSARATIEDTTVVEAVSLKTGAIEYLHRRHPILGMVEFTGSLWSAIIRAPAWRPLIQDNPNGETNVSISQGGDHGPPVDQFLPEQEQALREIASDSNQTYLVVCNAILRDYQRHRHEYLEIGWRTPDDLPVLSRIDELHKIAPMIGIHILAEHRDGKVFVGYEFHAAWDEEHGCGVLTHDGKVLAIGPADTAFDVVNMWSAIEEQSGQWD